LRFIGSTGIFWTKTLSWAGLYGVLAGTCEGGVGDENWRISDEARCMNYWDGTTGDAFHCFDHTADGGCFSRAEIIRKMDL
jgi:hypothetical protein